MANIAILGNRNDAAGFSAHRAAVANGLTAVLVTAVLALGFGARTALAQAPEAEGLGVLEAVRMTIEQSPLLRLQEAGIRYSEGVLQSAGGQFDPLLQSSMGVSQENTPLLASQQLNGISKITRDNITYGLELSKQFRSGISVSSNIGLSRINDNFSYRSSPNYSDVNMSLRIPLLRGFGREATAADEIAAEINLESSKLEYHYQVSESILNTVIDYWGYLAARQNLKIFQASEARAEVLVEETRQLIQADERPLADLKQLQANLADKKAARIAAEQAYYAARHRLGLTIGLPAERIDQLADPGEDFPRSIPVESLDHLLDPAFQAFIEQSILPRRSDLVAAHNSYHASNVLLNAASNRGRSRLDVLVSAGYTGLYEGTGTNRFFSSFNENVNGVNTSASIVWTLPTGTAHGLVEQRSAQKQQLLEQQRLLTRRIKSNIMVAINDLHSSLLRLKQTEEAIDLHQLTIENEKLKFQQQISTLIDLISVEERLTSAWLSLISARRNYATALARLRFETGTLLDGETGGIAITREHLTGIPFQSMLKNR